MLIDILTDLAADLGLHPIQQRTTLIKLLNAAAREVYDKLDANQIHREVTMVIPPNEVIAFPSFIGEFKGMRMSLSDITVKQYPLSSPRYVNDTQAWKWKNWRNMGDRPTHTALSAVGQLTIYTTIETDPVTLLIAGQTNVSNIIEESLILDSSPKATVNLFGPEIFNLSCTSTGRLYDIVIKQGSTEVAVLYNNQTSSRYKLIDVSQYPWPADTELGESLIDVLYKLALNKLYRDSDKLLGTEDYDRAWYYMAMYKYMYPIQNKSKEASDYLASALLSLSSTKQETEGGIEKKLSFGPNKFYDLFKGRRYMGSEDIIFPTEW